MGAKHAPDAPLASPRLSTPGKPSGRRAPEADPPALSVLAARSGDDLHILIKRRQKTLQALDGVFAEMALEQAGDFRLADAHLHAGRCLFRSVIRLRVTEPTLDKVDVALRRLDAQLQLPFETVQHIDDRLNTRRIDRRVCGAIETSDLFHNAICVTVPPAP